ncbi:hypothetical protein COCOBI_12-0010 [Coccomyxa sp. Obi]|nr:hypothetical protein COCOBI_12-0010 [Coccomyxa sp. Obi]
MWAGQGRLAGPIWRPLRMLECGPARAVFRPSLAAAAHARMWAGKGRLAGPVCWPLRMPERGLAMAALPARFGGRCATQFVGRPGSPRLPSLAAVAHPTLWAG